MRHISSYKRRSIRPYQPQLTDDEVDECVAKIKQLRDHYGRGRIMEIFNRIGGSQRIYKIFSGGDRPGNAMAKKIKEEWEKCLG